jgi:hypothetical protein
MNSNDDDPEIYNIICYMIVFLGFYVIYRVFTPNEIVDCEEDKRNEHSS